MIRRRDPFAVCLGLFAGLAAAASLAAELVSVTVPSGQTVTLSDILADENPGTLWLRFRFVAPDIARDGGTVSPETASADMDWLCENLALPYLAQHALTPARVVISLSDRAVPFGVTDPAATQFFETYRPQDGRCIWEEF